MNMLLSIVIPVYNRAELVVRTLDSIASSQYRPLELVIVDDGSEDTSLDVCRQWAAAHRSEDFTVEVLAEPHHGSNLARNAGLEHTHGDYVFFFDSDDLFCGDALDDVAEAAEHEEADIFFLPSVLESNGQARVRPYQTKPSLCLHILNSMFSTQSMVFRREWLENLYGWNEQATVWQDWELGAIALMYHPRVHWLCQRTYHRVMLHPESITGSSFAQTLNGTIITMRSVKDDLLYAPDVTKEECSQCVQALYFRAMIMAGKLRLEKHTEGVEAYQKLASEIIPKPSFSLKMFGKLLYHYTAIGGRGAWRLAYLIIR